MKHNSKKITAAICLIAAISSFSVMANAQEMPATQAGNIQENISYTNSPLFFYLNMLQNKLCPNFPPFQLPGAGCPDNTLPGPDFPAYPGEDNETPDLPELPDVPGTPELPDLPEVPGTPETPELPDVPETPELPENPGDTMSQFQQEVVELVNQERAKAGLNPLTVNADVTAAARIRCVEQTSSFSHKLHERRGKHCLRPAHPGRSYECLDEFPRAPGKYFEQPLHLHWRRLLPIFQRHPVLDTAVYFLNNFYCQAAPAMQGLLLILLRGCSGP